VLQQQRANVLLEVIVGEKWPRAERGEQGEGDPHGMAPGTGLERWDHCPAFPARQQDLTPVREALARFIPRGQS
jgi:hypothetical protein